MSVNRYAAPCAACGNRVPARGGTLSKSGSTYEVRHLACSTGDRRPQVIGFRFGSGATMTVNANGRCEDAPCCGCCS
jgi:hypothetical protein